MKKEIKEIIEATSMGKLEKEAVIKSLLNLHSVRLSLNQKPTEDRIYQIIEKSSIEDEGMIKCVPLLYWAKLKDDVLELFDNEA